MKSKHIATYGEEIAHSNFRNYHIFDNFLYKSTITALPTKIAVIVITNFRGITV